MVYQRVGEPRNACFKPCVIIQKQTKIWPRVSDPVKVKREPCLFLGFSSFLRGNQLGVLGSGFETHIHRGTEAKV